MKLVLKNYALLVCMYHTHPGYRTSIFGKNCAHYIRIITVLMKSVHKPKTVLVWPTSRGLLCFCWWKTILYS